MRITCVTSRYIPNIPHIVRLLEVDQAVLLDLAPTPDRNRTSFINRNRIVSAYGDRWVTIPIHRNRNAPIGEVKIDYSQNDWRRQHLSMLTQAYSCTNLASRDFLSIFTSSSLNSELLVDVNFTMLMHIFECLSLDFPNILSESSFGINHSPSHRLQCMYRLKADNYVAGNVELELMKNRGETDIFSFNHLTVVEGARVSDSELIRYSVVHWLLTRGARWTRNQILRWL